MSEVRLGEIRASTDPATSPGDAHLVFIGRARTPWRDKAECPKNLREARAGGGSATIEIDAAWRQALRGLAPGSPLIVLTWLERARRDLVVQAPRHSRTPSGTFAIRSPVRPNPVGMHVVRLLSIDEAAGLLIVDALDCLDGTPVLDIKPWIASVDVPPSHPA